MRPPSTPGDGEPAPGPAPEARAGDTAESFVRHSAVMSVGTALSRLTGFVRLAAMAFALGVTENRLADAFNVANTTPNIIYDLALGGIISSVFIPVFVDQLTTGGRERAWHTARAVLTLTVVILGALTLLGIVFSGPIIRLYTFRAQGPEVEAQRALASFLLKWFMPQILLYGLGAGVGTALLNAHRRFAWPMFAPILNNLVGTATFVSFAFLPGPDDPTTQTISDVQRYVLAVGTTLGVFLMTAALWPPLRRLGFRWRWTFDLADRGLRRIVRLSGWAFAYVVANQLGLLVVIVLAATVQGGYTAYQSAFIFFQLPYAIFAVSIMTAMLPSLSGLWASGERDSFRLQVAQGIRGTGFIVIPAAVGYVALAVPIIRLLLERGVMQPQSTRLVGGVLQVFALGLFSFCTFQILLRAFYAMQDTRTPALINVGAVALNTVVNLVYFPIFQVEGLALGHATAYTFAAIVSVTILRRRLDGLEGRRVWAALAKIGLGAAAAGGAAFVTAWAVERAVGAATLPAQLLQVGGGIAAGIGAFLLVALAFRLPELLMIRDLVLGRLANR